MKEWHMTGRRIDIHTHAMSEGVIAELLARGFKLTGGYTISVQWTPEAALDYMDRQGIAASGGVDADRVGGIRRRPEFGTRWCRTINAGHAELIANHPGRFGAFASLPADGPERSTGRTRLRPGRIGPRRCGADVQCGGATTSAIHSWSRCWPNWNDDRCRCSYPVDSPCIEVLGFGRPSSIIEFLFDTARNITNGPYTGFFQRYPRLRLILAHCGGPTDTGAAGRRTHHDGPRARRAPISTPPMSPTYCAGCTTRPRWPAARNSPLPTLQVTTADHILFGTDWPAAPKPRSSKHRQSHQLRWFTAEERYKRVERDNASRLFPAPHLRPGQETEGGHSRA